MSLAVSTVRPAITPPPSLRPSFISPPSTTPIEIASPSKAVLILGFDDIGRPHASRFAEADAASAVEAAKTMGMTTLQVASEPLQRLAAQLPPGRLFASGKAFVPFVHQALFDQLVAHLPPAERPVRDPRPVQVAASSSGGGSSAPADASGAKLAAPTAAAPRGSLPEDWSKLKAGHLVLASIAKDDGWWPAIITEDKGDGLYLLKWQDWSDWEVFLRKRDELALFHPNFTGA